MGRIARTNRPRRSRPAVERVMARIVRTPGPLETDCWISSMAPDRRGYSRVDVLEGNEFRPRLAHRVTYEHFVGPIPDGLVLDHLCRAHGCVNPAHLDPVTQAENLHRGEHPAMVAYRNGVCMKGHPKRGGQCAACRRERYLQSRGTPSR